MSVRNALKMGQPKMKMSRLRVTNSSPASKRRKIEIERRPKKTVTNTSEVIESEPQNYGELVIGEISTLYSTVWANLTMISSEAIPEQFDIRKFAEDLSLLRGYLVCSTCENLLSDDFKATASPNEQCSSFHLVCKICTEEERTMTCDLHLSWSPDLDENERQFLELVLESYKEFCALFIQFEEFQALVEEKSKSNCNFDAIMLIKLLTEGALATITTTSCNDGSDPEISNEEDEESQVERNSLEKQKDRVSLPKKRKKGQIADVTSKQNIWLDGNDMFDVEGAIESCCSPITSTVSAPPTPPESVEDTEPYVRNLSSPQKERKTIKGFLSNGPTTPINEVPTRNWSKRGCRCGSANAMPGKFTCSGHRCPCYVERKPCVGCKCKGCKNPSEKKALFQSHGLLTGQTPTKEINVAEVIPGVSTPTKFMDGGKLTDPQSTWGSTSPVLDSVESELYFNNTNPPHLSPVLPHVRIISVKKPTPSPPNLSKC